jgi:hypothetical protein
MIMHEELGRMLKAIMVCFKVLYIKTLSKEAETAISQIYQNKIILTL